MSIHYRTLLPLAFLVGCAAPTTEVEQVDVDTAELAWYGGHGQAEYMGLVEVTIPDQHPGIPFYARVGYPPGFPEGEIFETNGYVVIVFYRQLSCIPPDFNLLDFFHFPSAEGPGAWGCPGVHTGALYIEPDAPPTAFPKILDLSGTAVPVWAVDAAQFEAAEADGVVTLPELAALDHEERVATHYEEHIHARNEDHFLGIKAKNDADGFKFELILEGVVASEAQKIQLSL